IAYQGYARGVGVKLVEELSMLATGGYKPDLTILLDLNPEQVHMRVGMVYQLPFPGFQDPFEIETEKFHQLVRKGFLDLAESNPDRIKVIDASRSIKQVRREIIALVEPLLRMLPSQSSTSSSLLER